VPPAARCRWYLAPQSGFCIARWTTSACALDLLPEHLVPPLHLRHHRPVVGAEIVAAVMGLRPRGTGGG
jgi:hypothetical protein